MKHRATPSPRRYTVDAAAKALALLNAFSWRDRSLSLNGLARRTGIPRATAFRLLTTLEQAEFVSKAGAEYCPGIRCLVLGALVAADLDLRDRARVHLRALRDATGETTHVAVLHQWQVVYLDRVRSLQSVGFVHSRPGEIAPAYCTALGKVLLAYQPEPEVVAWAASAPFQALTSQTITTAPHLIEELRIVRERGYAVDDQEHESGVRGIAAPVRDHRGEVIASVSVTGPDFRMPQPMTDSVMAAQVCASARAISRGLGAVSDDPEHEAGFCAAAAARGGGR